MHEDKEACIYIQIAVSNLENWMKETIYKLQRETLMVKNYWPELDVSPVQEAELSKYEQSFISLLGWVVEIRKIEIIMEVSMLAAHMVMQGAGYLYAVVCAFAYLKQKHSARILYDPKCSKMDPSKFKEKKD
jgi:hypothetical protein